MVAKTVHGDLLQLARAGAFDVIVHGCNCFHTMGAGIAKPIKDAFPEAFEADQATPHGARDKLGTISVAEVTRGAIHFHVVNAYTQYHYRGGGRKTDYGAIQSCFEAIAERFPGAHIGYPYIGAGLGGGDWEVIKPIIDTALADCDHTLVVFQP